MGKLRITIVASFWHLCGQSRFYSVEKISSEESGTKGTPPNLVEPQLFIYSGKIQLLGWKYISMNAEEPQFSNKLCEYTHLKDQFLTEKLSCLIERVTLLRHHLNLLPLTAIPSMVFPLAAVRHCWPSLARDRDTLSSWSLLVRRWPGMEL